MRLIPLALLAALLPWAGPLAAAESIEMLATPAGVRFGLWPKRPSRPAPTMFVFAGSIEYTLDSAYFRQAGDLLAKEGWILISLDLPCHGKDVRPKESSGLSGWRMRIDKGEDIVEDITTKLRGVLDYLIKENITDPKRIAALGTSRGGFVAYHFAAADERVKCAAGFAPVTDLLALSEFRGAEENPLVQSLRLERRADAFAGRAVWLVIGDRDDRVSTDAAIRFARLVTTVSLEKKIPASVNLLVLAEPGGHRVPKGCAKIAAEWFREQFSKTESESPQ